MVEWYSPPGFVSGDLIFLSVRDLVITVKPPLFLVKHPEFSEWCSPLSPIPLAEEHGAPMGLVIRLILQRGN